MAITDKALGLDSMTMAFLQGNWDTISGDVMRMFTKLFSLERFVANLNSTFVSLIARNASAENIRDFSKSA